MTQDTKETLLALATKMQADADLIRQQSALARDGLDYRAISLSVVAKSITEFANSKPETSPAA